MLESYTRSITVRKPVDVAVLTWGLRNLVSGLARWSVLRDLTSLGSGALLSQLILVAGAPVVLRLSGPADFGLYAVAYGFVTLLATLSTCKVERLIVGVAERRTAIQLLAAVFWIGGGWTLLFFVGLVLNRLIFRWAPSTLQAQPNLMWLAPIAIFVQLSATGLRFYAMRTRRFTAVAIARVLRSVVFIAGSSAMMLVWPLARRYGAISLLTWQVAGDLTALLVQFHGHRQAVRLALFRPRVKQGLKVVLHYRKTLGALSMEQVLGDASQQITIWTAAFAYGAMHAGWYSLATTLVSVPSTFLALPLADLLYQRLSRADAEARTLTRLVLQATILAAVASIVPFGALLILGPSVLSHLIGPQWSGASQSIMILATGTYLFCVTTPATAVPVILHAGRFIVLRQALQAPAVILCATLAEFGLVSYVGWLVLLVVCRSVIYLLDFAICYSLVRSSAEAIAVNPRRSIQPTQPFRVTSVLPPRWNQPLRHIQQRLPAPLRNNFRRISLVLELLLQRPVKIALFGDTYSRSVYEAFTAQHPRFPLVRRKSFAVALRDLRVPRPDLFAGPRFELLRRKVRRARRLGYTFRRFDPYENFDSILHINASSASRQGRAIRPEYLDPSKVMSYCASPGAWYGVFDADHSLRGYCHVPVIGDCCVFSRIMGDARCLENGMMYLLVSETLGEMHWLCSQTGQPRWAMYDMFLGGLQGLRNFKHRCGFDPYRVAWRWRPDRSE